IPHTIQPTKELPPIKQPVVIDGTTEPSYVLYGHPVVEIDGSRAPANASGLRITGGGSEIRGLVINRFGTRGVSSAGGSAIVIEKIGGNVIEGNYLGTDVFGHGDRGNRLAGVSIQRSSDNRIGGPAGEQRNVIAANGTGVAINGQGGVATRNAVIGNYVGVDAEGDDKLGNEIGVDINQAAVNTIGGPGAGNVISANAGAGVEVRGTGSQRNVIAGNLIGTDAAGTASFGNFRGVFFTSGALDNVVGGTATGAGNLIAFNSETGVLVPETGKQRSVQIEILGNSIHSNGIPGLSGLGIDLTPEGGVTPNDATDADLGGNRLMNFPVLTSAVSTATGTTIEGTLTSEASRGYRVELFASPTCDANGHGEGRDFLGAQSVTTDAARNGTLSFTAAASVTPGWFITATSTEEAFGNTSEFSACLAVNAPPFVQADGGSLTLGGEPWYL
ncbi:MAG TPA: hypothetical protein VFN76_01620, partial [Candidatus Limnocylindria bacterium]|nr:hypothetical protein [Candidatus Limnocylindria bacterium]